MKIGRRALLAGGGAGVGLVVAWALWPRGYAVSLNAARGEHVFGGYVKIGEDGHVTVVVPQTEMGQGSYTGLPQILADELGADWRTVGVEPAPVSGLYANALFAREVVARTLPAPVDAVGGWAATRFAESDALMVTAGSTSVRAFEAPLRQAGATARALLCMAAAERLDADWRACDTAEGFVVRGNDRLRFGALAARAAALDPPDDVPLRVPAARPLMGKPLPRLDVAAKLDGSAQYAADVRVPGMVFAAVRQGPIGRTRLVSHDAAAARRIPGFKGVVANPGWIAALAETTWAADRALEALSPRFETRGRLVDDAMIAAALDRALAGDGARILSHGSLPDPFTAPVTADYAVGFAAHAAIEPLVATARVAGDRAEIWAPTQAPARMRAAVAAALGIEDAAVVVFPVLGGGGFGRKLESDAAVQAALIARAAARPVQLQWSRAEESAHDRMRPPARARMTAQLDGRGGVAAWRARIAAPDALGETLARIGAGLLARGSRGPEGAAPPYGFPAVAVDFHAAAIGVPAGVWRSGARSFTTFFTESFMDEIAARAAIDPLSYRLRALGGEPRLARCLSAAAAMGGWLGGRQGSPQGLACCAAYGSHIALLAEVHLTSDQEVRVDRVHAAVDCGTVVNPDLVVQQIEGGILFALSAVTGTEPGYAGGLANPRRIGLMRLPTLADSPEIHVQILPSTAPAGGVAELAVPPVAPAVANALFAGSGQRYRRLPIRVGAA